MTSVLPFPCTAAAVHTFVSPIRTITSWQASFAHGIVKNVLLAGGLQNSKIASAIGQILDWTGLLHEECDMDNPTGH